MHRLPRKKFEDGLMKKFPEINDRVLLGKILDCFGTTFGDSYIILNNEYYEDGNCYYNLSTVISRVFKVDGDPFDVQLDLEEEGLNYKEIYDAFEELGLDEEDYPDPDEEDC